MSLQKLNMNKIYFLNPKRIFSTTANVTQSLKKWYKGLWTPERINLPPYEHFTQVGDPVLRQIAAPVPNELIDSKEIDLIIDKMVKVLRKYECVGVAAPQIGVSLRIIVMEFPEKLTKKFESTIYKSRKMSTLPLTVFVNPVLKITNHEEHKHVEGCMSVRGYAADVTRYDSVKLTGIGKMGTANELDLNGWSARIAQHEMDHLDGKLYIDKMDTSTFNCTCWEAVNTKCGRVEIPFYK